MLAAFAALASAGGQAQEIEELPQIEYVTRNRSLADLEIWMTKHYEHLQEERRLPVQAITDDVGTSVQILTFGLGLLRGDPKKPVFPQSMDRLLCNLNPKVCRVDESGAAHWKNKKGDQLCFPDVRWVNGVNFTRIEPIQGERAAQQLEERFGTCTALGAECEAKTRSFQRNKGLDGKVATVVLAQAAQPVPAGATFTTRCADAPSATASEKIRPQPGSRELRNLEERSRRLINERDRASRELLMERMARAEASMEREAARTTPASSASGPAPESVTAATPSPPPPPAPPIVPNPIDNDVLRMSNLIEFRIPAPGARPVNVLVFDWQVNSCHLVLERPAGRRDPCPRDPISEFGDSPANPFDHGNHVAALIGGEFGVGVNPLARITPITILGANVTRMTDALQQAISNALAIAPLTTKVANFSLDLRPEAAAQIDGISSVINGLREVLFVAAAGDEPGSLDGACNVLPACAQLPRANNLIVVGGASFVNESWALWPNSRHGKQRVDILAPAEDVRSAVHDDGKLGRMSGSSQSAAIVSGIATRLSQAPLPEEGSWAPLQIKNRLLATVRFSPALTDFTRSGVVDADRALDTSRQVLVFRKDGQIVRLAGRLLGVKHPTEGFNTELPFLLREGSSNSIDMCRIYRLSQRDGTWTVGYEPLDGGNRWSQLVLESDIPLRESKKELEFQPQGASSTFVPIGDVIEFYDKFSEDLACNPVV
jgi:hypothetical protein